MSSLVPPDWVGCLRRFGLKTGIVFAHFDLESGMIFQANYGSVKRAVIVSIPNE